MAEAIILNERVCAKELEQPASDKTVEKKVETIGDSHS